MNVIDFNYDLPEKFIAQSPLIKRDEAKLMVLDRFNGEIIHEKFKNIINYLKKGDVLVLNDTKVLPARLLGRKETTDAHIEIFLLKDLGDNIWEALAKPQKRLHVGTIVNFNDKLKAEVKEILANGIVHVKLIYEGILVNIIDEIGNVPLPPYIHEELKDDSYYQTVYAKYLGSAAAPTAGLHFTDDLLEEIKNKGIIITYVTLHVGLGTFRPVMEDKVEEHKMHSEWYNMPLETANILNKAKKDGRRIIAVGTTSCRTLESNIKDGLFKEETKDTSIYIYPGYKFQAIDGLITNFHLPKSTLIMLVAAFSSKDIILNAYEEAKKNDYRFFSFGDAMFLTTKDK